VWAGVVVIGGVTCWMGREAVAHAQGGGGSVAPQAMRADLRIRQRQVNARGRPVGVASPGVTLHVDRRQVSGRWHVTITLADIDRPRVRTNKGVALLDNPFFVTRLEYDEGSGGEPTFYDAGGRRVTVATDAQRRQLGLTSAQRKANWDASALAGRVGRASPPMQALAAGLVSDTSTSERDRRRQRLEQRYGRSVGRVRGLDRFVVTLPDETEEALVAPDTALPVEINATRQGALIAHLQLLYDRTSSGYVRRLVRSEQAVGDAAGSRAVTEIELANLDMTGGAR
jgi:hypothetical protein